MARRKLRSLTDVVAREIGLRRRALSVMRRGRERPDPVGVRLRRLEEVCTDLLERVRGLEKASARRAS